MTNNAVTFEVGLPLSLEVPKVEEYIKTIVVGWERNRYLITRLPYIKDKPVKLKGKDSCLVRFLRGDNAYGFSAEVITIQFFPVPLIFFQYPEQIESMSFRKFKRVKTNIQGKLLDAGLVTATDLIVMDLSEKGCLLKVMSEGQNFQQGGIYYLTFKILDRRIENIQCVLKNEHQRDERQMLGVEFQDAKGGNIDLIRSFIKLITENAAG
ncbi:MAG: flagellar brake protein [Nitrospirae bacterium]|nr:flagellar brake protein [Nitrospirota bacterium]